MKKTDAMLFAAALALCGAASANDCMRAAELAEGVAEAKSYGMPLAAVQNAIRAQYREDSEEAKSRNLLAERVVPVAYALDGTPRQVGTTVYLKCKAGEFEVKK